MIVSMFTFCLFWSSANVNVQTTQCKVMNNEQMKFHRAKCECKNETNLNVIKH